jgi:hypothetical protein
MKQVVAFCLVALAAADCYMHNPRGSNNRLNENDNNPNQNRLFDSQNNNKGGYCWGDSLTYYEGSELTIEWTAQHSCGTSNNDCQIVLQYMCGSTDEDLSTAIRDGTDTTQIPDDATDFMEATAGVARYGMHESYAYYSRCTGTQRNKGLFIADRQLNGNDADHTRQNQNGNRRGFECSEERDYYPYWRPTPWIDIAVLTNDDSLCDTLYNKHSQNVESKYECVDPNNPDMPGGQSTNSDNLAPITETQCTGNNGEWLETPAWGLDFDCISAPYNRDNHLGNGLTGWPSHYNWTLPSGSDLDCLDGNMCQCVLRIRYNISTFDTDNWQSTTADEMPDVWGNDWFIDWEYNGQASPLQQDPTVDVGGFNVTLTLNTNQYGRTFQDRSHIFLITERPTGVLATDRLYNLNVRGKRGNIVQAYPAVEYDFVPTFLEIPQGSYVHFHWTGCDNNPGGNDGSGTSQTDRSNLIQMRHGSLNYPNTMDQQDAMSSSLPLEDSDRLYFASAGQSIDDCPTYTELVATNGNNDDAIEEATNNCQYLNAAPRHFDGGVFKFQKLGATYDSVSTRNNNFSNRSHKGGIRVTTAIPAYAIGLIVGGAGALLLGGLAGVTLYLAKVNPYSGPGKCWKGIKDRFHK